MTSKMDEMRAAARKAGAPEGAAQVKPPATDSRAAGAVPEFLYEDPAKLGDEQVAEMQRRLREIEELRAEKRTVHVNLILRPSRVKRLKAIVKAEKVPQSTIIEKLIDAEWERREAEKESR